MGFSIRVYLVALLGVLLSVLGNTPESRAQTSPGSASAIRQTERENKIKIVGSLCTPPPQAPASGTAPAETPCGSDPVKFLDVDTLAEKAKTVWIVAGGTSQTGVSASATFATPGTKTISISRTYATTITGGTATTALTSFTVNVGDRPLPFQNWRPDTTICKGTELTIDPYPGTTPPNLTYLWFPKGETTQAISTTASGCYSVEVTNEAGCSTQDRIRVSLCPEQNPPPGSKWYFGGNAGLDFQGDSPTPLTDGKLNTLEGSASITDQKGNILFYSDGITIFDKDGNPMRLFDPVSGSLTSGTAVLGGNQRSTQSALIVPKPVCKGCDYEYYVYTTAEVNGTRQITYSVVDMRRNDGKGAVVQQNLPVVTSATSASSTERSASVRRDRDTTYWVMTHDYGTNCFRVNHLTTATQTQQKQFCLGTAHDSPARGEGQMKIGPAPPASTTATSTTGTSGTATQGNSNTAVRPVAVIIPGDSASTDPERRKSFVEIFSFDVETGEMKGPDKKIDLGPAPPTAYGVEFSPDGSKIYVSLLGQVSSVNGVQTQTGPSRIVQYDIKAADPASTSAIIDESTTRQYGSLQIGPDGKIYVAVQDKTSLAVIDNPDGSAGFSSTNPFEKPPVFTVDGQTLGGKISQLGLPNQVVNFTEPSNSPGISVSNVCQGEKLEAQITPYCPKLKEFYNLRVVNSLGITVTSVPSFTQTSQTLAAQPPGSYTAVLDVRVITSTGATCTTASAESSFTVIVQPPPFSLGPDISRCDTEPVSLTINADAEQYAWVLNRRVVSRSKVLITSVPGTYTAFVGNGGQCFESDAIEVTLYNPGRFDLGPDVALCDKDTRQLRVPTASGFTSFTWSTGESGPAIRVSNPGTYSVVATYPRNTVTGPVTCRATDRLDVVTVKNPTITPALTNPAGCTTLDGRIQLTPAPTPVVAGTATPTNSFTYAWTPLVGPPISTSGSSVSALSAGTYTVLVTDENSCTVAASYTLTSRAVPPTLTAQTQPQRCSAPGSGSAVVTVAGSVPSQFTWRNSAGGVVSIAASLTGVETGTYSITVTDAIGCVASLTSVLVGLDTRANITVSPNRSRCVGDTVQLIPSRLGDAFQGIVYRWSTGATTPNISVNTAGTYSLTALNTTNGCTGTASVAVQFVAKPTITTGPVLPVCLGGPQSQTLVSLGGATPSGGQWSGPGVDPAGTFRPDPLQVGQTITFTYSVTVAGCANSAPRQVALRPNPQVAAGPDVSFCENSLELVRATGSPGATFRWNDGTQGSQLLPRQTGRYVVVANLDGCESNDDLQVTIKPLPRFTLNREVFLCIGDNQQTRLRVVPETNDQTVVWTATPANVISSTLLVSRVGTYSVAVTGSNGCTAADAAKVIDQCEPRLFAPNVFSPNGDGLNDRFKPVNTYTLDLELRVFNRWGEVIFASTPDQPDWDGTYRGEPAQAMVYPYVITYRSEYFPQRPALVKRGSVLLLR